jgi:tetratricopeptide (TPR) repeat protein
MAEEVGNKQEILNKRSEEDLQGRKSNKNNLLAVVGVFLLLITLTVIVIGYLYLEKSDYQKGIASYKDKNFTEALFQFQKIDPDDADFINAQSRINYIKGLNSFNDENKPEAVIYLAKVTRDDEYYSEAQLMLGKLNEASIGNDLQSQIDALRESKDTVIIRKEVTGTPVKIVEPADPTKQADLELSRKFVSDAENTISRFEGLYQTTRTAPLSSKSDYAKGLESVHKEFNSLKYSAQNKDAGVVELRRLASDWMSKRNSFIRQLISEKSVTETSNSIALKEEGDRLYSQMMSQLKKVKKSL